MYNKELEEKLETIEKLIEEIREDVRKLENDLINETERADDYEERLIYTFHGL